jgi:hypothetical protein
MLTGDGIPTRTASSDRFREVVDFDSGFRVWRQDDDGHAVASDVTRSPRSFAVLRLGQAAGQLEHPPQATVADVGAREKHHRAGASDDRDAAFPAERHGAF